MTNPLGDFGGASNKIPIGVAGVEDYVETMNREHGGSPYLWRVGERWSEQEGRKVKCVDVIKKTFLRYAGGPRATPDDVRQMVSRNRLTERHD